MKKKSTKILPICIITSVVLGISLFAYGIKEIRYEQTEQKEVPSIAKEFLKENQDDTLTENKSEKKEPKKISKSTDLEKMPKTEFKKIIKEGTYGLLEIPSLKLEVPVTMGISDNVLNYYVGMYETSDEPGTPNGNTALAGHSIRPGLNYCTCCYFDKIDELSIGDSIILTWYDGNIYEYEVTKKYLKKNKNSTYAYENIQNESLITLVTCSDGDDRYRTFIQGKLKKPN